ncbi:alpha-1,2-galactosyltransferase [Schizosaccharomyces cryophilus OY26]|uniref:Alpha-1,2-galactosyltransferase n=1 Tax=Schizosaccharomyces cryophilus (strain OY26 / ATCC MYA-4695 / CBS 11777 / NBRC 106824 / NRRL Y48691) TaxID=653667 RepID=S9WWZ9_SCHCR|nr:alpha-1,2-galactosyltransferase [Schizosaccharomyces cryophilus OY26]EPY49262.1 alpha-1,2-galactosyltransferase [Schizosaccharomyces cryophilus OY26]
MNLCRLLSRRAKYLSIFVVVLLLFCLYSFKSLTEAPSKRYGPHQPIKPHKPVRQDPNSIVMLVLSYEQISDDPKFLDKLLSDRNEYAQRHGYQLVHKEARDIERKYGNDNTWSLVTAIRETLFEHPEASWVWVLDPRAVIMNTGESLKEAIMNEQLSNNLLRNYPVDPLKPHIRTNSKMNLEDVKLITTNDYNGISIRSFLLRNDDFAPYLLDAWNEPLFKPYKKDLGERSALSHLLEIHPTILEHVALVSPKVLNSYTDSAVDLNYQEGDFLVLSNCENAASCERFFDTYVKQRRPYNHRKKKPSS